MRWVFLILAVLACVSVLVFGLLSQSETNRVGGGDTLRVLVAYNPALMDEHGYVLDAYVSVLEEEGIPHETVDLYTLRNVSPAALVRTVPVLILPDGVCRRLHSYFAHWLDDYVAAGGALAVIHDVGIKSQTGGLLPRSFLSRHTGVQHIAVTGDGTDAFTTGTIAFADSVAAALCRIPPGKLDETFHLTGYGYGRLEYPVARSRLETPSGHEPTRVLAWAETEDSRHPAVTLRGDGPGAILYVNMPLGHLKAYADDLPLRALLRMFLCRVVGVPALVPSPDGIGAVVINWHIDFADDRAAVDDMAGRGLLREDVPCTYHVCAGPDVNTVGDGQGFDACGKGRHQLALMAAVGEIGSHGGWTHNLFAANVESGVWDTDSVTTYVQRNSDCLRETLRLPVSSYSAPAGVHPQPMMTSILEELGFGGYYYTGDSGSSPNRSFHEGARLSDTMVAFPVMPRGRYASLAEMDDHQALSADEVLDWLSTTADYCRRERTIRLVYSHPYNLTKYTHDVDYRPAFTRWYDELADQQTAGVLKVRTMSECADFLRRLWETEFTLSVTDDGALLKLVNPDGLKGVALSLSRARWTVDTPAGCRRLDDEMETILVVRDDLDEIEIPATMR